MRTNQVWTLKQGNSEQWERLTFLYSPDYYDNQCCMQPFSLRSDQRALKGPTWGLLIKYGFDAGSGRDSRHSRTIVNGDSNEIKKKPSCGRRHIWRNRDARIQWKELRKRLHGAEKETTTACRHWKAYSVHVLWLHNVARPVPLVCLPIQSFPYYKRERHCTSHEKGCVRSAHIRSDRYAPFYIKLDSANGVRPGLLLHIHDHHRGWRETSSSSQVSRSLPASAEGKFTSLASRADTELQSYPTSISDRQ